MLIQTTKSLVSLGTERMCRLPHFVGFLGKRNLFCFSGTIEAFKQLGKVKHNRQVTKEIGVLEWMIKDTVTKKASDMMTQHWNVNPDVFKKITFAVLDDEGNQLDLVIEEKWYSSYYDVKEKSIAISFSTTSSSLETKIIIKA